jgi:hypothetical protein
MSPYAEDGVVDPNDELRAYFGQADKPRRPKLTQDEQRLSIRASVEFDAALETAGHSFPVRVLDVSKSGLCLESPEAIAMGTTVDIVFDARAFLQHPAEHSAHVSVNGQVVRLIRLEGHVFTLGVRVVPDAATQRTLQSIVLRASIEAAKNRTALRPHPGI